MTSKQEEKKHLVKKRKTLCAKVPPPAQDPSDDAMRLRLITETIEEVFWMASVDIKKMLYISPGYEKIWGRTCASLYRNPQSFIDAIHPEDRGRVAKALIIEKTGQPFTHEYRIIRPGGEIRWILDRGFPVRENHTQKIKVYAGIAKNITEQKKVEEGLLKAKEYSEHLLRVIPDAVFTVNTNRLITSWNRQAEEITGYSAKEIIGKKCTLFAKAPCEDGCGLYSEDIKKPVIGKECVIRKKNGQETLISKNLDLLKDNQGNIVGGIESFNDITGYKHTEDESRKSESRYRSSVELTGQLAWTTDGNGKVVEDIPLWRKFTGLSSEETKGSGWTKAIHPEDLERTGQVWHKAVKEKTPYEVEFRLRRFDGIYRSFLTRGIPVFEKNGNIREWVGVNIDITERKISEETLLKSQEELAREKAALEQKNIALAELAEHLERTKNKIKDDVATNISETILPIIKKLHLKGISQKYVSLLELHLQELTSSFGRKITEKQTRLSPKETEICNLLKGGMTSKDISQLLNSSSKTVDRHRRNIRKKLAISGKKVNLVSHLKTL